MTVAVKTYLGFEHVDLLDSAGVCLANDRDDVDLLVDLLHHLHVQRLEAMSSGSDEVEAGVYPGVSDLHSLHPGLSLQVGIKLILNIVHNRSPTLSVVHCFTKAGSVNYCQGQFDSILNQHSATIEQLDTITTLVEHN